MNRIVVAKPNRIRQESRTGYARSCKPKILVSGERMWGTLIAFAAGGWLAAIVVTLRLLSLFY